MWADHAKSELAAGRSVQVRPRGHSMTPRIRDGALVTLEPVGSKILRKGDVVLVTIRGVDLLHQILSIKPAGYQIGNLRKKVNGWVSPKGILGVCVLIEN
jgi:phage repressor protein C with HTH and peptisase S24 domain